MELKVTVKKKGGIFDGRSSAVVNDNLAQAMYEATMLLERAVKERTPQGVFGAQGGLLSTIFGEVIGKGTPYIKGVVATQSKYGEVVEKGRRPGQTWPPEGSLIRWIQVKMGVDQRTARSLEFVIRRKIGMRGFPGAFMFQKALEANMDKLQDIFDRKGFEIARELS